jgi:hypothetical protein
MQVRTTTVFYLADSGVFLMMVNDFSSIEVNLTREQHAHNQGMHPEAVPIFSPVFHPKVIALSWLGLNLPV